MPDPRDEPLGREVWVVASVVVVGVIMSILDTTIVNVALETLSRELDAPLETIQWVATGYLLALATVIPLTGWASERFGSKRIWMISVALFGVASALCGLAWSAESLIVFRILQGFGGGMIMPVGMSLLMQAAGPDRAGRVMAVIGVPMLLGPIFGPVIGGSQPETQGGFSHPLVYGPVIAGLALVAAFVVHARRAPRPLIDVGLFRHAAFSAAAATTFLLGGALFGAMIILPLYFQIDRGETALTAGLLMAPQGVGAAIAMPMAGRLTDRIGAGPIVVAGLIITTLATIPLAFVSDSTSYGLLAALLVVRGVGMGGAMMPSMAAAYSVLKGPEVPRATSALNVIQRVGGSLGTP